MIHTKCVGPQFLYTCSILCSKTLLQCTAILCHSLKTMYIGTVYGLPTLHPISHNACPNDVVTFICHGMQASEISWIVEPHTPRMYPIKYTLAEHSVGIAQHLLKNRTNHFFASLTNVTNIEGEVADMTSSLTVVTDGLENWTNITCSTVTEDLSICSSSSLVYIAGLVHYPFLSN